LGKFRYIQEICEPLTIDFDCGSAHGRELDAHTGQEAQY
jgi:hypothetical protein